MVSILWVFIPGVVIAIAGCMILSDKEDFK